MHLSRTRTRTLFLPLLPLLLLLLLLSFPAFAENNFRPSALSFSVKSIDRIDRREMEVPGIQTLLAQDSQSEAEGQPPRFAVPIRIRLNPRNSGTWEYLNANELLWRLRITSPGALTLNFGFLRYWMPRGGRLLLYPANFSSTSNSNLVRSFNENDNESHGQLWTPVIPGDDVILEVVIPRRERFALKLQLGYVNHDYKGFGHMKDLQEAGVSASCNVDVACPEGDLWRDEIRSVGVMSVNGTLFCTGSLVNNTAENRRMYFITARHCGVTSQKAPSLVVYWNYQNSFCRPTGSPASGNDGDGVLDQFQTGAYFRASYLPSDFTLVELDDPPLPSFHVFWAGWDRSHREFQEAEGIHHPRSAEKRISLSNSPTVTTSYYGIDSPGDGTHIHVFWTPGEGVTQTGSSGSPLYNGHGRLIGQLHGGPSSCTSSDKSDYYGRFSVSWNGGGVKHKRLSDWLDPLHTGVRFLNGLSQ